MTRTTLAQLAGCELTRRWENDARKHVKHRWLTDCRSLSDYINNPIAAGCEDKRLEIDLEQFRQGIWEYPDGTPKDFKTEDDCDKCDWVDTSTMLADCLTKMAKTKVDKETQFRFIKFLQDGVLDFEPTSEAKMKKLYQSAARKKAKVITNAKAKVTTKEEKATAVEPGLYSNLLIMIFDAVQMALAAVYSCKYHGRIV